MVPKPTIFATVIRHDPTNANSVRVLLLLRTLASWRIACAVIVDKGVQR